MPLLEIAADKVTDKQEITTQIAKDQYQYATLPSNYSKGVISFAFELDEKDLEDVMKNKRVYVLLQTGGPVMPPINVGVNPETFDDACEFTREHMTPVQGEES